jgi:hypothetical protein
MGLFKKKKTEEELREWIREYVASLDEEDEGQKTLVLQYFIRHYLSEEDIDSLLRRCVPLLEYEDLHMFYKISGNKDVFSKMDEESDEDDEEMGGIGNIVAAGVSNMIEDIDYGAIGKGIKSLFKGNKDKWALIEREPGIKRDFTSEEIQEMHRFLGRIKIGESSHADRVIIDIGPYTVFYEDHKCSSFYSYQEFKEWRKNLDYEEIMEPQMILLNDSSVSILSLKSNSDDEEYDSDIKVNFKKR